MKIGNACLTVDASNNFPAAASNSIRAYWDDCITAVNQANATEVADFKLQCWAGELYPYSTDRLYFRNICSDLVLKKILPNPDDHDGKVYKN